jgi:predicted amidohydrolase YtcJ
MAHSSEADMIKADIILTNGRVFRGLAEGYAEAVALWSGKVMATGTSQEIEALRGSRTRVIDLAGRLAAPGLYDAHMHLLPLGLAMSDLDARPKAAPTLERLLDAIRRAAQARKPGEWILARGYDQFQLDTGRHPTRDELDNAAPDNPVYLVRTCGHISICNSMALKLAGIDETSPVPQGGAIEQRDGRLTGLLAENARDPVKAVIPSPTDEDLVAAIERAGKYCLSLGITSVMDAGVGMRSGWREIVAYREAQRTKRLPVRTYQCLLGGPGGIVERAHAEGMRSGVGDDMLTVGCVKIFTDGSAGGRTAAMTQDYLGEPATKGLFMLKDEEMDAFTRTYHDMGYQLAVHAIGDAAIEQSLDAIEKALEANPDPERRHRIEHCGFIRPDQIERMARLGIEPAPQPVFIHDFGDLYVKVLGPDRPAASYPMRAWIDHGLKPSASTDAPVCDADPFPNLFSMVTRKTRAGNVIGGQEVLSIEEALAAYTEWAAYACKSENHRGRLVPGMAADIAVFSRDFTREAPEMILETRCDMTIRGGEIVFEAI